MKILFAFSLLVLSLASSAINIVLFSNPDSVENKHYEIFKTDQKMVVDGKLSEDFWKDAVKIEIAWEVNPAENIEAPVKSYVYMAHSDNHLYVGFEAFDPEPEKILAHYTDRDKLFNDDWVGVILDTYNDERRSFDFICNPLGVQCDAIESNDFDDSWDTIWDSEGRITNEGYIVEMSIPFSSLRFQNKDGRQVWGFDAVRSYPRSVRHHIGTYKRDRENNCYLCQALKISGFEEAKPGKNIELAPTLSLNLSQSRADGTSGSFQWNNKKLEPGFTGKWGITPNITISTTVNPDFSHVEADAAILDVNEPFALYFSEKRPFFTEGSDFFSTKINAVYTRSLRNPEWGVKLTGKEKTHTIGAYLVKDEITNLIFPGSQSSQDSSMSQSSYATVLRYKKDFGNKYTMGVLLTDRQGENYYNRVYGFDGNLRITNKDIFSFMVGGSLTKYPEKVVSNFDQPDGKFSDKVVDLSYNHNSRNLDYYLSYEYYGDDFRADQGFIPQVGYEEFAAGGDYTWINKQTNDWWTNFILETNYGYTQNMKNELLREKYDVAFIFLGTRQMHSFVQYTSQNDLYEEKYFKQNKYMFHTCIKPVGEMQVYVNIRSGDQIDYANTRLGKRFNFTPGFTYSLGKHLNLDYSFIYDQLNYSGNNVFKVKISDITMQYQFNRQLFFRTIIQYRHYNYNVAMYDDDQSPEEKNLFTQMLLSYKINPQTVLFIGYSDNYDNNDQMKLIQTDRNFFFKVGYAFVL